jgi:hypothetical protein
MFAIDGGGVKMIKFLFCKAAVTAQITVFLAACASQPAPDNFEMDSLAYTRMEPTANIRPVLVKVADHRSPPSTYAAIGEFSDLLRGETLGLGYEADIQ